MEVEKQERKKRGFIVLWLFLSGFVLWFLNLAATDSDGFFSYILFNAVFWIGCFAFYYFMEMSKTPLTTKNKPQWNNFFKYQGLSYLCIFVVFCVAFFEKYIIHFYAIPTMVSLIISSYLIIGFILKGHKIIQDIKEEKIKQL